MFAAALAAVDRTVAYIELVERNAAVVPVVLDHSEPDLVDARRSSESSGRVQIEVAETLQMEFDRRTPVHSFEDLETASKDHSFR